jgi:hypothetical protein
MISTYEPIEFGLVEATMTLSIFIGVALITIIINPFNYEPAKVVIFGVLSGIAGSLISTLFIVIMDSLFILATRDDKK